MRERIERTVIDQEPAARVVRRAMSRSAPTGLTVGCVDDPLEHQADRMAGAALMALRSTRIQRAEAPSAPSPAASAGPDGGPVDRAVEGRIRASTGRPLEPTTASRMSTAFCADMSGVRIHTGTNAAALSDSLNARAFTVGSDIFFAAGQFRPGTSDGQHLLAHELAHTVQQSGGARRAAVVRRKIKLTRDPSLAPNKVIKKVAELKGAINAAGIILQPGVDDAVNAVLGRWFAANDEFEFADAATMIQEARTQAAERAKQKADVTPFALKAEEAAADADHEKRVESPTSHYDFRHNPTATLPDIGGNPMEKKKARGNAAPAGYYYHVSSYTNLRGIFATGLNPNAGGGDGGASVQSADKSMNAKSANDSRNKVFVATVGKLTQRYLSLRLRQNDLLGRHGECIANVLAEKAGLGENAANLVVAQICLGEEPVVLRFKDQWTPEDWMLDPVETMALALHNRPVPAASIECLSLGGWVPLTTLTEITTIIPNDDTFKNMRSAVLAMYADHNAELEQMSAAEGWNFVPKLLIPVLAKKNLLV